VRADGVFKVGELAERSGLSVRTLHHYHEIGLLVPSRRTPSGHRLYGREELDRLQRIRSLKQLGFSLEEIGACLEDPRYTLARTLRMHRERLDDGIEHMSRLRERLARLERLVEEGADSAEEILETIEVTTMIEKYYTPEQLERLAARRVELGAEAIEIVERRWTDLARRVNAAIADGLEPESPEVAGLAREWRDLTRETVAGFTGGDPGFEASLDRAWKEEPDMGAKWGMGAGVRAYMGRAMAALED